MCRWHSLAHTADIQRDVTERLSTGYGCIENNFPGCTWLWTPNSVSPSPAGTLPPLCCTDTFYSPVPPGCDVPTCRSCGSDSEKVTDGKSALKQFRLCCLRKTLTLTLQLIINLHPRLVIKQCCIKSQVPVGPGRVARQKQGCREDSTDGDKLFKIKAIGCYLRHIWNGW